MFDYICILFVQFFCLFVMAMVFRKVIVVLVCCFGFFFLERAEMVLQRV